MLSVRWGAPPGNAASVLISQPSAEPVNSPGPGFTLNKFLCEEVHLESPLTIKQDLWTGAMLAHYCRSTCRYLLLSWLEQEVAEFTKASVDQHLLLVLPSKSLWPCSLQPLS